MESRCPLVDVESVVLWKKLKEGATAIATHSFPNQAILGKFIQAHKTEFLFLGIVSFWITGRRNCQTPS